MSLIPGQRFVVLENFETPKGMPKSKYLQGHSYSVTEQNAAFIQIAIEARKAALGGTVREGVRLGAETATVSGTATVK